MSFKFSFEVDRGGISSNENDPSGIPNPSVESATCGNLTSDSVNGSNQLSSLTYHPIMDLSSQYKDVQFSDVHLCHSSSNMRKSYEDSLRRIISTKKSQFDIMEDGGKTDLIPGVYEGGLKVWECSIDLCRYLSSQCKAMENGMPNDVQRALSDGGSTLELGCGQGLPACFILREIIAQDEEASLSSAKEVSPHVWFTDYNSFVLRDVTMPNIWLNANQKMRSVAPGKNTTSFFKDIVTLISGDWLQLSTAMLTKTLDVSCQPPEESNGFVDINLDCRVPEYGRFDLILASETTYTSKSAQDTATLMMRHLKFESGVGLVAMKRYYFGVGGGSDAFRDLATNQKMVFNNITYGLKLELVEEYKDGISNIRDLWSVRCVRKDK